MHITFVKSKILLITLVAFLAAFAANAIAGGVPMSTLTTGDKVLVSNDGSHFTEMFFVESCYVKTDKEFKETVIISSVETNASLVTWQNKYTKTLNGEPVIADVVTMFPAAKPREYSVAKTQLLGLLTQLDNLINPKEDPSLTQAEAKAKAFRSTADLFTRAEEITAEIAEIRKSLPD